MTQYFFATIPPATSLTHCLTVPSTPGRVQSFSSVDKNINNVVMERKSGSPWDEIRYFVITPDQRTEEAVRAALQSLGVDADEIFTERIPETFQDTDVDLTAGECTTVTTDMIPHAEDDEAPGDPALHGMFSIAVRAYVKRGFERGPDPAKQLPPHRLTFTYE